MNASSRRNARLSLLDKKVVVLPADAPEPFFNKGVKVKNQVLLCNMIR